MWRVFLSVFAAGFDGLMMLFFAITIPNQIRPPILHDPRHAYFVSDSIEHARQMGLIVEGLVIGGIILNLLAIAFGARLRFGRAAERSAAAAEFA